MTARPPRPPACKRHRQQAHRSADEGGPDLPGEDLDAVLPGDVDEASARQGGHQRQRNQLPSAGPYYVSFREPNRTVVMKRNPNYKGPRPRNLDAINFKVGVNLESGYREVLAGQADYQEGIPTTEYADLARRFGVNKTQFRVSPSNCVSYIAMNTKNDLFRSNPGLRQAVNFAINRRGDGPAGRPLRRPAARPDPPAGLPRASGTRTSTRLSRTSTARARWRAARRASGQGRVLLRPHAARSAADGARPRLHAEHRHQHRAAQGFRGFAIYDAAGTPHVGSRLRARSAGARTTRIRTTSSTFSSTAATSRPRTTTTSRTSTTPELQPQDGQRGEARGQRPHEDVRRPRHRHLEEPGSVGERGTTRPTASSTVGGSLRSRGSTSRCTRTRSTTRSRSSKTAQPTISLDRDEAPTKSSAPRLTS